MKFRKFILHHKALSITLLTVIAVILIFVMLCFSTYIPRVQGTDYTSAAAQGNPNIVEGTLISAHRAGRLLAPENTMAAFKACFENNNEYRVDVLEFDLHLTKDGNLILLHDDTLDRTSNCREDFNEKDVKPINKTVAELKQYNMGYQFADKETGEYPYRKANADLSDCRIVTLNEVLTYLRAQEDVWKTEFRYIIEIKNGGEDEDKDGVKDGYKAADILKATLIEYGIIDRTIVGTFHGEVSKYLDDKCPEIIRSAGIKEVLGFYFSYMFGVSLDNVKYKVLQIPYKDFVINLGKKGMVDYAHKYGIAVQYWTINKAEDIEHLTKIGADAIMSDDPKLAYDIITELTK